MAHKNQPVTLLKTFAEGRSIGQLEAITELGIGHLSSLVSKMIREWNCPIKKVSRVSPSGARYTAYSMDKDIAQEWLDYKLDEVRRVRREK